MSWAAHFWQWSPLAPAAVRYREKCATPHSKIPQLYGAGALPAALDLVLSTVKRPAVVLIDGW